jgi:ribosomal protein S18 acetylase RimI-like enzyme
VAVPPQSAASHERHDDDGDDDEAEADAHEQYHTHAPDDAGSLLLGCLDVSWKTGPCGSSINGVCVPEGEQYAYIDNVCVQPHARRGGVASALLDAASGAAMAYGALLRELAAESVVATCRVLTRAVCVWRCLLWRILQARSRC